MYGSENSRDFDQFVKGIVHAFREVLDIKPEVVVDDEENENEV